MPTQALEFAINVGIQNLIPRLIENHEYSKNTLMSYINGELYHEFN